MLKKLLLVLLVFSLSSCATLFGSGKESVLSVESDKPLKISVISDDGLKTTRKTPFTVELDRSSDYKVNVISDQYESESIHIGRKIRPLAFLNLLDPIGWIIDVATGNAFNHKRHHVYIDTQDLESKASNLQDSIKARILVTITGADPKKEKSVIKMHKDIKFNKV